MRRFVVAILLIVLMGVIPAYSQVFFTVDLTGANEAPPVTTNARGSAWVILNPGEGIVYFKLTFARLGSAFTSAQFRSGAAGTNGGILHTIPVLGNTGSGEWFDVPDSVMTAMLKGNVYINIHTISQPNGEIRGQLKPNYGIEFAVDMSGLQEVPPVTTGAKGTGWVLLRTDGSATYQFTIAGLSGALTGSHFHIGAEGVAGGVVQPITVTDSTVSGTWAAIPDSVLGRLMKGEVYANFHTGANPGGEIRGQLTRYFPLTFNAIMSGQNEVPPVTTSARGIGWVVLGATGGSLGYQATYTGLSSSFAGGHFHVGAPGVTGPIIRTTAFSGSTSSEEWVSPPDSILAHLVRQKLYWNIHSDSNTDGEIRGQVLLDTTASLQGALTGAQMVPPVVSTGNGTAWASINLRNGTVTYAARANGLSGAATGASWNFGATTDTGTQFRTFTYPDSNHTASLTAVTDAQMLDMLKSRAFIKINTALNPKGELRGQMLHRLSAAQPDAVEEIPNAIPTAFRLFQNYPNPFNPVTFIEYSLLNATHTTLKIYNLLGQEVATLVDQAQQSGTYRVTFDASSLPSGVYMYQMTTSAGARETRKMMLMK